MLERLGYDPRMARHLPADATIGRVLRVDRGLASVLTESGPQRASFGGTVLGRMAQDPLKAPCTGDWGVLREWPGRRTTLEGLLPRRTAVVRAVAGEQSHGQVLCANVDIAAIVVALHPLPVMARVERLATLAWESGAQPLVVLTKTDLVRDADELAQDIAVAVPDVDVVLASAHSGLGIDDLRGRLDGRLTMALLGASGHGKSSLVNALVGAEVLATREIRQDGRGRHTSVRRELVPLPTGGAVVDTPGLRGVGLIDAGAGLGHTFLDVEGYAAHCRFADCAHRGEPGCAVAAAVDTGDLPLRRFESWQRLHRELDRIAARQDARLRAERGRDRTRRREARRAR